MAISDSEKLDFLWKKLIYGTSKTASAADKAGSNETVPSPLTVFPDYIWADSDLIPAQPPTVDSTEVKVYTGADRIAATNDPTSTANMTWFATATPGDVSTRLTGFIPSTFGSNYAVKVYVGDPEAGGTRIFPDTLNQEWVFDYAAGTLIFTGTIPAGVAANGVYFEGFRYQGATGGGGGTGPALEDGFELALGDEIQTDDESAWDEGAVTLTAADSVSEAISKLNKKLKLASTQAEVDAIAGDLLALAQRMTDVEFELANLESVTIPLGDDIGTDDESIWNGGLVPLAPTDSTGYAISRLNHKIQELKDTIDGLNPGGGGATDGFELPLGDIAAHGDGSWAPGAVPLTDATPVSEAVDRLNEVLAKLIPSAPPEFPNGALSIANAAGNTPRVASGFTDNTGTAGAIAGTTLPRITAAGVTSNVFGDVGPGDAGTLSVTLNGAEAATHTLTGVGDNGTYTGLVIADQKAFPPATPGFWTSLDVSLSALAASVGVNAVSIEHSEAGATSTVVFIRDDVTANPAVTGGSVVQAAAGTLAYSSGVPHYGTGAQLTVGCSISNLSGQTYYGGADPLVISGVNGIITSDTKTYADLGITTPIAVNTTAATAITSQTVDIDGANVHNQGTIQATAKNVNGSSAATNLATTIVLVKRGTSGVRLDEASIPVSGLGASPNNNNATRVGFGSGDKPAGAPAVWDSSAALAAHEATVVGGVLKHDVINYSTGYLPAGPNYSTGRTGAQYATFSFKRTARSAFKIAVTGSYAGCWVQLPGVTDAQPNGGGWWDGFKPYDGAGVPGETGDADAGCALGAVMTGASGTFQMTFGTESSTNADDNEIIVRFRLNAGQSITALSFTS